MGSNALQKFLHTNLEEVKSYGQYRESLKLTGKDGPIIILGNRELLNFSSHNYLRLEEDPRVIETAMKAVEKYGIGLSWDTAVLGLHDVQLELEEKFSKYLNTEAVLIFQSDCDSSIAAANTIITKDDIILCDELNQTSIVYGCRLSGAKIMRYRHNDIDDLRRLLSVSEKCGLYKKKIICIDGVFGTEGDIVKLPDISKLAQEYDAIIYLCDSYSLGALGEKGSGTVSHFGLYGDVECIIGTFSTGFGVIGGYAAGSNELIELMLCSSKHLRNSLSIPPAAASICLKILALLEEDDEMVERLWANTNYFRSGLKELGYNIGNSATPIVPVIIGEEVKCMKFKEELFNEGIITSRDVIPALVRGKARVINILTAAHTIDMLDRALDIYKRTGQKTGMI